MKLKKTTLIDLSKLQSFEDLMTAASDVDMIDQLEEVLMMWYKQIEQVSAQPSV